MFLARKPLIAGVYIGHAVEVKRNENPKKNQSAETYLSKHTVLWGSKTFENTVFIESQDLLNKEKPLLPEFTPVFVEVISIEETDWGNRFKGRIHKMEQDEAKK